VRAWCRPEQGRRCFDQLPATLERLLTGASDGPALDEPLLRDRFEGVVLVYFDAFGWTLQERHAEHTVLAHAAAAGLLTQLTSQFPSTTTAQVTTIHTGLPVAEHGLYEWHILEPALDRIITPLLFSYAGDGQRGTLLGSLEQWLTSAGVPIGHLGEIDSRGRISSGHRRDEDAREAAVAIAHAARAAGYFGPCGVDSLLFRAPDGSGDLVEWLRPILEFNARFTLGIVAIGLMRRLLSRLRRRHGLSPGERRAFLVALEPPVGHDDWASAARAIGAGAIAFDFTSDGARPGSGVLIARDRDALAPLLGRSAGDRTG